MASPSSRSVASEPVAGYRSRCVSSRGLIHNQNRLGRSTFRPPSTPSSPSTIYDRRHRALSQRDESAGRVCRRHARMNGRMRRSWDRLNGRTHAVWNGVGRLTRRNRTVRQHHLDGSTVAAATGLCDASTSRSNEARATPGLQIYSTYDCGPGDELWTRYTPNTASRRWTSVTPCTWPRRIKLGVKYVRRSGFAVHAGIEEGRAAHMANSVQPALCQTHCSSVELRTYRPSVADRLKTCPA